MKANEIRDKWINYFVKNDHMFLESASLVPIKDDSLLWINSGVATLKDYFTGKKKAPHLNLVNYQKSLRTNDIENVGFTARHQTFFEMLGNFSVGGYFKKEMISMALDFLINVLKFDKNKLYVTYFFEDKETYELWKKAGIEEEHLIPGTKKTNFWDLGQGPCGPNTEIFFDRGEKYDPKKIGIELLKKDIENDRYIEIWNIVFSEFNNDGKGNYEKLNQKNIDTGAGLERIASIMQDVPTNFDTDLFIGIIHHIEEIAGIKYRMDNYFKNDEKTKITNRYFKIIADHVRAATMAINDGVAPSNVGRGYIIRRLIRRAYRTGIQLGINRKEFLYLLIPDVQEALKPYKVNLGSVAQTIKKEEQKFAKTILAGEELIVNSIKEGNLDEKMAFKLFETYGFPLELTIEVAAERNINLDLEMLHKYSKEHSKASKRMINIGMDQQIKPLQQIKEKCSDFVGYEKENCQSEILYLFNHNEFTKKLKGRGMLITKETPFYATKGGQFHDFGLIKQNNSFATIIDVFHDKEGNNIHVVEVNGELVLGKVELSVDHNLRACSKRNHSATHLLYSALINTLGDNVLQLGSDNNQERLKFDYPLNHSATKEELQIVEEKVNEYIKMQIPREYLITTFDNAKDMGALSLPKNKLNGKVRVVRFGQVSLELCGGTHVDNTSDIEQFLIIKNESKGSGIYRIEAITSKKEIADYLDSKMIQYKNQLLSIVNKIKEIDSKYLSHAKILPFVSNRDIEVAESTIAKELQILKQKSKDKQTTFQEINLIKINNINIYIDLNVSPLNIAQIAGAYREKDHNAIAILGTQEGERIILCIASHKYNARNILNAIFARANGKGGGTDISAQGSCKYTPKLESVIKEVINDL